MGDAVEGQIESLKLIRTIEESLADLSGDEFFVQLVITLARSLDVHCAFVTEFTDDNTSVSPLAMWCDDELRPPNKYPIAGTPCEAVLDGDVVSFDQGVVQLFPDDQVGLVALGAESFLAIPLKNRLGRVIGHVALMDNGPRNWDEADISVLRLFAARATTEVERRQFEQELRQSNRMLEGRVRERTRELAVVNEQLLREIDRERRLGEELAESEAGFRAVFEHSPVSIWELDLTTVRAALEALQRDGIADVAGHVNARPEVRRQLMNQVVIRRFNRASLNLFGIEDPRTLSGAGLGSQPDETLEVIVEELAAALAGARVGDREVQQRHSDGSPLTCHVFWSVPPGYENTWSRLLVSFVDLTEQKQVSEALERSQAELEQRVAERTAALSAVNTRLRHEIATRIRAEQALSEREAAYRDLYENAPNVYWSTGANGLIQRVNSQASALFGYSRDEMVGKPLLDMLADSPHGKPVGRRVFQRFLEGKATLGQEVEFRAADGHSVWVNVNVVPILDEEGRPVATRSMLTDITARKAAEQELARRLDLDRLVVDVSTVLAGAGAVSIDEDLEQVLTMIGERGNWDAVSLVLNGNGDSGIAWRRADAAIPEGAPAPAPGAFDGLQDTLWWPPEGPAERAHWQSLAGDVPDPQRIHVAAPLEHGERLLGVLHLQAAPGRHPAVTPRDRDTVSLLADLLASTLARCTAERALVEAKRVAESASKAKSDFLANMSHELRTPLNVILGYTQLLRRQPDLAQTVLDRLATLQRSGEHLLHLIDDVLQLARVEAGKLSVEPRTVQLKELLDELTEMFGDRVRERDMTFRLAVKSPLPATVETDDRRLRQVLINLLGNAVKFSPPGSTVTLEVVGDERGNGRWDLTFAIVDQGVGIAEAELERIFEPFVQLGAPGREGVGLGLAITRTLVTALDGTISVTSRPGDGSTFVVSIPVQEMCCAQLPQTPLPITGYRGPRRTLMLVDDRAENRTLLHDYLESLGFLVLEAPDGAAAVSLALTRQPDLALIDLVMPDVDGFETIRRLRAEPALQALKVVAVSASAFDSDRIASLACGGDAFLPKPLDLEQLADTLATLLNLEWERHASSGSPAAAAAEHGLDAAAVRELARAAELGDVSAIDAWLDARADDSTDPLVIRVREHRRRFDVSAIQRELHALEVTP